MQIKMQEKRIFLPRVHFLSDGIRANGRRGHGIQCRGKEENGPADMPGLADAKSSGGNTKKGRVSRGDTVLTSREDDKENRAKVRDA